MKEKINTILAKCLDCDISKISPEKCLFTELYIDSLMLIDIVIAIGIAFGIELTEKDIDKMSTVNSIYLIVEDLISLNKG
ncbi:acyl carrier protein [Serratia marcescens]|uniref:acyl carrier protein n=1 Tax=Serratia marcescens TaxID=615 RepID=UPI00148DC784|nr:phosphopantetheine-binding protein [Serratia marcescens]QJU42311.1 acyl carrier protein [Serratia marcescens]